MKFVLQNYKTVLFVIQVIITIAIFVSYILDCYCEANATTKKSNDTIKKIRKGAIWLLLILTVVSMIIRGK